MKRTPWFSGTVKPVRDGVYERKFRDGPRYCLFRDGEWWMNFGATTPQQAASSRLESLHQFEPWRGLAEPPKGKR